MSTSNAMWRRWLPSMTGQQVDRMHKRTIHSLAALLFLVQIPHLRHLPAWVSVLGMLLVSTRLALLKLPAQRLLRVGLSPTSVTLIAVASALLIKWDYGYFIGRDPCVAFLFVLVAAKFAEVRRPNDATLLLCLCAFLLLTQYFYSQTIVSALVTVPAVVALAYCLSTLRDASNPEPIHRQLKMIGGLLLQGLPVAIVLFLIFPRLPGPLWSLPEDAMATTGLSDSMSPGSIGQLSQSGAVAFRVEFDDEVPSSDELYWRGPVLSEFDGRNWAVSRPRLETSPDYPGPTSDMTHYTVTLQPHRQRWLFALDLAASLPRSYNAAADSRQGLSRTLGQMFDDRQILARDAVSQTLRYRQSSVLMAAIAVDGKPGNESLFLPGQNARSMAFARSMRSRYSSDSDYAQALMRHFNEQPYRYTLQPQVLGHTPVDEFLFDTREGFCEHYASAFVVLMRAAGIASRVVTGYQGGEMNGDYMIVRQSDAHAWAEAFIDGAWKRFDPTSAVAPSRIEGGLSAALPDEASVPRMARQVPGILRDIQLKWDTINHQWQRFVIDFDNDSQAGLWERAGLGKPALWQLVAVVMAFAGICSVVVLGVPRLPRNKKSPQEHYWQTLVRILENRSMRRNNGESAHEFLLRAASHWPAQRNRIEHLDQLFSQLRFQYSRNHGKEYQAQLRECRVELLRLRVWLSCRIGNKPTITDPDLTIDRGSRQPPVETHLNRL